MLYHNLSLVTADRYWKHIEADQGLSANRSVSSLKQNVKTLRDKIRSEFVVNEDKAGAERLVEALAVNRLTTPNIDDEVGLTAEDLKNRLLWRTPIPMTSAPFLSQAAKRLLESTRKAANGQFLAVSQASAQYFIDPKRTVDYGQDVATYAETLSNQIVQRYLNEMVTRALEIDNDQPVLENRLWNYSLMWESRNVERPGWLFFGFPNQRSTAKPPRDFYLFLLPSERITGIKEAFLAEPDEAYFSFEDFPAAKSDSIPPLGSDAPDSFLDSLRKYAAAREREVTCRPGDERNAFKGIADKLLKSLAPAFVDNAGDWVSVLCNGQKKKLRDWVMELDPSKQTATFKSKFDAIAQVMFAQHFSAKYPSYPTFPMRVTEITRKQVAQNALEIICKDGITTQTGKGVLATLGLYKDDAPTPDQSPWLAILRQQLTQIGAGKMLNHSELFERKDDKDWWKDEKIEAEWLIVTLAAGIAAGDLVVVGPASKKYDASNLREFYTEVKSFEHIIHVTQPTGIPLEAWRKLFQIFGLKTGTLANANTHDDAVKEFQKAVAQRVGELVTQEQELKTPLPFASDETQTVIASTLPAFGEAKATIETTLAPLNTKAKMAHLKLDAAQIAALSDRLKACADLAATLAFTKQNAEGLGAIQRLSSTLGEQDSGFTTAEAGMISHLNAVYVRPERMQTEVVLLTDDLQTTRDSALKAYQTLHKRYRLGKEGDKRKGDILGGKQLKQLNRLVHIKSMGSAKLEDLRRDLDALRFCPGCSDNDILKNPLSLCPHCNFDPRSFPTSAPSALEMLVVCEEAVAKLNGIWTKQLLQEIKDPLVMASLNALKSQEFEEVNGFLATGSLPAVISDNFISAMNTALGGLKRKAVRSNDFATELMGDGTPLKPTELRERFESWLKKQVGDEEEAKVRFVLEF